MTRARSPRRSRASSAAGSARDVARARTVYRKLRALYPGARCELDYRSPYELAVATILSAQCTDKRVNQVTPALFAKFPDPAALARARLPVVERMVRSTGFFRNKARSITGLAKALVAEHGGRVPDTMDALTPLPGIGRKTANVILGNAFNINAGVVVDTHIGRLARRLGFTRHDEPVKVERDLMALFPRRTWTLLAHLLIWHGRRVCAARAPRCHECALAPLCPSALTPK